MASIPVDPAPGDDTNPQRSVLTADAKRAMGLVFVVSGPSGVGKDTIKKCLQDSDFPIGYCVTATTRQARDGEVEGVHYFFVSDARFQEMLYQGELIEHAVVHGKHSYGIPIEGLRAGMRGGHDVLVTPDVQGAATLRAIIPNAISIFVAPTSLEELKLRIADPKSGRLEEMETRLKTAAIEMRRIGEFDYLVVNEEGKLDETIEMVKSIVIAERLRVKPRRVVL
ncbi:MAG: guanylate kinase [Chloroflexi bacterium]|nr:guanylate kinase [Chloroflexota bacterium]